MEKVPAMVYCEGAFSTTYGKTAHGLVRFTLRYHVVAVIDSTCRGMDAGEFLDQRPNGIPVVESLQEAMEAGTSVHHTPTHLVIGLAPDGGRLSASAREDIIDAIKLGLNIDSGLHDFLSDDPEISSLAASHGVTIRDIRKTPPRSQLHDFTGKISAVDAFKIAVLGTDSALGKRTTAWKVVQGLNSRKIRAEMIGTGQTSWLQGARYGIILDSLINDFVAGELEHAIYSAWEKEKPQVILIEGQGSLLNPAYPGGFEILAAGRPDCLIVQHAPRRVEYDGFPGYPIHPLDHQLKALMMISSKKVLAIALNHELMKPEEIPLECERITRETGIPCFDVLTQGADGICNLIVPMLKVKENG